MFMDERRPERRFIDRWISDNNPDGILLLAQRSRVSSSTITKIRLGYVPKKRDTRLKLCEALGVTEDELFPLAPTRRRRAS